MKTIIELDDSEVKKIIEKHVTGMLLNFVNDKHVYVSAVSYSCLAAKVNISDITAGEEND